MFRSIFWHWNIRSVFYCCTLWTGTHDAISWSEINICLLHFNLLHRVYQFRQCSNKKQPIIILDRARALVSWNDKESLKWYLCFFLAQRYDSLYDPVWSTGLVYIEYLIRILTSNFLLNYLNFGDACKCVHDMCI